MPDYEMRAITADELPAFFTILTAAFGDDANDDELAIESLTAETDRTIAAFDGSDIVATAGASTATVATYKQLVAVHPQRTARVSFTLGRCGQVISPVFRKRSFSCRHAETGISKSVLACRSPIRQCEPR